MKTIKYINQKTNEVMTEVIVATKLSVAKNWAKQFVLHHPDWKIISIF